MSKKSDCGETSVDFLYKAMRERDPTKRRVKPVADHLIQVDFEGDSEDDSDFDVDKYRQQSNESDNDEEDDDDNDESDDAGGGESDHLEGGDETAERKNDENEAIVSSQSDEEDDEEEEEDGIKNLYLFNYVEDEDDEDYVPREKKKKRERKEKRDRSKETVKPVKDTTVDASGGGKVKVSERIRDKKPTNQPTKSATIPSPAATVKLKVLVCCVCLVDNSEAEDEVVECDNCGACVHEGCYGVSDSQSTASTDSSASTEPWFCDSCKAGVTPSCELCPNDGGIYKETDAGKWVHLVCALYIPGIAFGDVEKLTPVTLFEMPYTKWGAKQCSLCEDAMYSSTGVCVCCDAGMCRNYFHVTCAQMQGLLSQASLDEVHAIADPFFAYCKLHAEKGVMQVQRRNWLAVQSRMRQARQNKTVDVEDKVKVRVVRKLEQHKLKYLRTRAKRPPSWVPTTKMVRHLTSSPSAVRRMMKKAQLMGIIMQVDSGTASDLVDTRKKSVLPPAFTPEFITYFIERNHKIGMLKQTQDQLTDANVQLHAEETALRTKYEQLESKIEKLNESVNKLKTVATSYYSHLSALMGKSVPVPVIFKTTRSPKSPSRRSSAHAREHVIHKCGICGGTNEQSMLARCDNCKRRLHLGCLEPPLTRMPKKTKLQGWQCSECMPSTSDDSDQNPNIDMNAPRKLREKVKGPQRFLSSSQSSASETSKVKGGRKAKRKKRPSLKARGATEMRRPPVLKKETMYHSPLTSLRKTPNTSAAKLSASKIVNRGRARSRSGFVKRFTALQRSLPVVAMQERTLTGQAETRRGQAEVKVQLTRVENEMEVVLGEKKGAVTLCCICDRMGTAQESVVCDTCEQCYHFHCLDPPRKKSPKQCGYGWHCGACDAQSTSESEESEEIAPPVLHKESNVASPKMNTRRRKDSST